MSGRRKRAFRICSASADRHLPDRVKIRMKPVLFHCCLRLEAWVLFTVGAIAPHPESNTKAIGNCSTTPPPLKLPQARQFQIVNFKQKASSSIKSTRKLGFQRSKRKNEIIALKLYNTCLQRVSEILFLSVGGVEQLRRSNQTGTEKPGFSTTSEKCQLCLVADSTNSSIFGILEISTQLS